MSDLRGFTIGITADRRWEEQAAMFERRGAAVMHGRAIQTLPLGAEEPMRRATAAVIAKPPAAVIANTGIGMRSWFAAAESWGLGAALHQALAGATIYARGPKASGAVHSAGLAVTALAPSERLSEAVTMALEALHPGERAVLQLDGSGTSSEVIRLLQAGADLVVVPTYLWRIPEDRSAPLRLLDAVIGGQVQALTFTAAPALHNFMAIATAHDLDRQLRRALHADRAVVGCVGPVCAAAAVSEGLGLSDLVKPATARLGPLVRAVASRLLDRRLVVDLGATHMVLSGTVVTVGDQAVQLSPTEARLLGAMAARPNVVFTKEHLVRTLWAGASDSQGAGSSHVHAVEAAIARLRRRLGPHGHAVVSVRRRGYALRS